MKAVAPPVSDSELAHAVSSPFTAGDWRKGVSVTVRDQLIEEVAVALVYNGISHVVMMATPDHLEDFALGFSLTEGIIERPAQLYELSTRSLDKALGAGSLVEAAGNLFRRFCFLSSSINCCEAVFFSSTGRKAG